MAEYGLIKSFDIDNGELSGLSAEESFVLGYELAQIDTTLKYCSKSITQLIHAENRERVTKSCQDSGRSFKIHWMEGDQSESWLILSVDRKLN